MLLTFTTVSARFTPAQQRQASTVRGHEPFLKKS